MVDRADPHGLTPARAEVLRLVQEGLPNKEIAYRRGTSEQAVKRHVSALLRHFDVGNRSALIRLGVKAARSSDGDREGTQGSS